MNNKPSIPQGTRDFSAEEIRKRNHILSTIKTVFELYGFQPLETPAMENLETLMGKYGEEGDKLIFKILNNGLNNEKNIDKAKAGFEKVLEGKNSVDLTERALKYDLTIPFARYVAMNHTKLTFPFRRYQIQPVWRADRPQKGRYREFTQCDADVVGSYSLLNDAEFALIYDEVFTRLGLTGYELRINSRKILSALAKACNATDKLVAITTAIDKLDKISIDKVKIELAEKGLTESQVEMIEKYVSISGSNNEKIDQLINLIGTVDETGKGVEEIKKILHHTTGKNIVVDFTLARGLNYYTGIIYEAKAPATVQMGSIGGGGRYDDLTGLFGVPDIPGVGISFGVDRIYDVLKELELFPENLQVSTRALFFNMGEKEGAFAFDIMQQLRKAGVACELYHREESKIAKQFSYAEKKNIPFAVIIGSKEIEQSYCQVKNLSTGEQHVVVFEKLADFFNSN
ncbi:histidine--tRNA ligase [Ferruginibacter sp. SUN106]|uniref:histidine--tRNA ligase n=1 Tax=Ferruginibacter sp. SUN106 TaxID=2978348 RepID=UPI003D36DECC